MKGAATIDDVARQAGVAISTVSHVVNGTRFVSEATRMAVERAIVASGYIPNSLARSLARSRTNTIGIALATTSNPYFLELVYAFAAECIPRKWMTLLADTKEDPDVEEKSVPQLHERRVDGIILATCGDENSRSLAYLEQNRVPTVLVDRLVSRRFSQVGVENKQAVKQLVEHLYNLIKFPSSFPLRRIFTGLVGAVALAGLAAAAPASAAESTIPIIVKDTTSGFWQIVLAGARKAGKDFGVKVPELGAQAIAENQLANKIKLVGFDSDDKLVKLLKDGTIAALIVQDPYGMGYEGVKTALAASKGRESSGRC